MQLEAIYEHNEKLPPKKKAKEALINDKAISKNSGMIECFYCGRVFNLTQGYTKNMNDIAKLQSLVSQITDTDRPKFDRVYNEVIYPRMVNMAEKWKKNELSIGSFQNEDTHNKVVGELFSNGNLQNLVETKMKPYLEEKGFKVAICSPNYYVYIRW